MDCWFWKESGRMTSSIRILSSNRSVVTSWVVLSKTKYSRVVFWWKIQPEKTVPNRMNRIKEIHNFFLNFITFSFYRISLPSGILEIIVRLVLNRKISETISDMISAVRKAHHTAWSPPNFASTYAAGISTTSWRMMDTIILNTAFPSAWNTVPQMMPNHASK